jgi:hypothetical protein
MPQNNALNEIRQRLNWAEQASKDITDIKASLYDPETGMVHKIGEIDKKVDILKEQHSLTYRTQKHIGLAVNDLKAFRIRHDALDDRKNKQYSAWFLIFLALIPSIIAIITQIFFLYYSFFLNRAGEADKLKPEKQIRFLADCKESKLIRSKLP